MTAVVNTGPEPAGAPGPTGVPALAGVQVAPWVPAGRLVAAAAVLGKAFDVVWVPDQMLARNIYALLAAVAAGGQVGVGSAVAVPLSRNPIDLASSMATIAELAAPDRPVLMGMGAGGSLVASLLPKRSATAVLRESVELVRRLWTGEPVPLADYPTLAARLGWRPGASARLTYPVTREIPILVAVGGPKTLALAEDATDGLLGTSTFPPLSYAALRAGDRSSAGRIADVADRRARAGRPMRLIYGLNCCVSADRAAAREFARRQAALVVGNPAVWPALDAVGLDLESAHAVRAVLDRGEGVEAAARAVADDVLDAFVVSGTPAECVDLLGESAALARAAGFTECYLGVPLGPDLAEAARILVDTIAPELWPARR